jgi:ABC-2 type transport system ATP-binding protein
MLRLADIRFRYNAGAPWAVGGVTFSIGRGEVFGLLGPNGAGKTTLMSLIAGLFTPQDGTITRAPEADARGAFALVPQEHAFYPMLTCRENLEFFAGVLGLRGTLKRTRVESAMSATGLAQFAGKRAAQCSGGMKRRLNLAIGLTGDPQLLLLDEPTVGVDPQSRAFLLDTVRNLRGQGRTVIYTSHYMDEVQAVCDRVAIIDHGRVLCCDSLAGLLADTHGRLCVRVAERPPDAICDELAEHWGLDKQAAGEGAGWLVFAMPPGRAPDAVLAVLRRYNLKITGVQFGSRHLEDVFLRLTHRSLRD